MESLQAHSLNALLSVDIIKKTNKNEPKVFPSLLVIDKEAFGVNGESA